MCNVSFCFKSESHYATDVVYNVFCLFLHSARLLPEKLTVYTTLVGLLNARNYNFGGEFVEAMIRQLKETLKSNLYSEALCLVCAV